MGEAVSGIRQVEDMPVYQEFFALALQVEELSGGLGMDFRWLRTQVLRSSESVCANLTEGFYSQYSTEYVQALYRCRREARETITHIRYGIGVGRLGESEAKKVISDYDAALAQLANLIGSIERKIEERGKAKPASCAVREEGFDYVVAPGEELLNCDPADHRP